MKGVHGSIVELCDCALSPSVSAKPAIYPLGACPAQSVPPPLLPRVIRLVSQPVNNLLYSVHRPSEDKDLSDLLMVGEDGSDRF